MWRSRILALFLAPFVVLADLGSYTDHEGLRCTWSDSMGGWRLIHCEGDRRATGEHWSYTCYALIGPVGVPSWSCRDRLGNAWNGHH